MMRKRTPAIGEAATGAGVEIEETGPQPEDQAGVEVVAVLIAEIGGLCALDGIAVTVMTTGEEIVGTAMTTDEEIAGIAMTIDEEIVGKEMTDGADQAEIAMKNRRDRSRSRDRRRSYRSRSREGPARPCRQSSTQRIHRA